MSSEIKAQLGAETLLTPGSKPPDDKATRPGVVDTTNQLRAVSAHDGSSKDAPRRSARARATSNTMH